MRGYPEDEYEKKELKDLRVKEWQIEALMYNPKYPHWGPREGYMSGGGGWAENVFYSKWTDFGPWELDDYNECVHYYFYLHRSNHPCFDCDQTGYNLETKKIADDFYDFGGTGKKWCDKITQDEVEVLVANGRLPEIFQDSCWYDKQQEEWIKRIDGEIIVVPKPNMPTSEEVNAWQKKGIGHDAINRSILIRTRAKRLGVYGHCPACDGNGIVYDEQNGKLGLVLWMLHPRKGASRGVEIKEIRESEMPSVLRFLQLAAKRNAERFSGVTNYGKL